VAWATCSQGYNGAGFCQPTSIATDHLGNIAVAGSYSYDSIAFGSVMLHNGSGMTDDVFLLKFDNTGLPLWGVSAGGNYFDRANGVAFDDTGNIYMAGVFASSGITLGSYTMTNVTPDSTSDIFMAKLAPDGSVLWASGTGATGNDDEYGIALDPGNNFYIAGGFSGSAITFGTYNLTFAGGVDMYVAKYGAIPTAVRADKGQVQRFSVFPNPATNAIFVHTHSGLPFDLRMSDCMGRDVSAASIHTTENEVSIDVSVLHAGTYILKLVDTDGTSTIPVVVMH
jgi:hypothetical protein